ncbi:Panacea domain-containing protein [Serratia fonticola]|uniref:Panacea domain-containing protein n=1 Tax=Serratia fonticola TaxID=47917 RepID=UPI003AAEDFBF
MFCEQKVAQMAAYLLHKRGGRMAYLKLMKLLYLSDRKSLIDYGDMMSGDRLFSMKHGPVLSETLDLMRNTNRKGGDSWGQWIEKHGNDVQLKVNIHEMGGIEAFDELSKAEIRILDQVYGVYGHMNRFEVRDMTHLKEVCPEWKDPGNSRRQIFIGDILLLSGKSNHETEQILQNMRESDILRDFSAQMT